MTSRSQSRPSVAPARPRRRSYDPQATRQALLNAAARVFARDGYRRASLRDICRAARTRPGSVHYHFGSKLDLYRKTLVYTHQQLFRDVAVPELQPGEDPAQALHRFVAFALRMLILRRPRHFAGRLIAHELRDPTPALTDLVQLVMIPVRRSAEAILAALLGDADDPGRRAAAADLVFGMCLVFEQGRPILERFGRKLPTDEPGVDHLARTVAHFALGGVQQLRALHPLE